VTSPSRLSARVALVFPPVVSTNFGNYYPSTAVLSAYLERQGVATSQHDLNEEFALHLLSPGMLSRLAGGWRPDAVDDPFPALGARLLERSATDLFDAQERHRFRSDLPGPGHLLGTLAEPFAFDRPLDEYLDPGFEQLPVVASFAEFFEGSRFVEELPGTVRVVGLSVAMGSQLAPALVLARRIRALHPDVRIVLGGATFGLMQPDDIEAILGRFSASLDAIVPLEGELPLAALTKQALSGAWDPASVPGVCCGTAVSPAGSRAVAVPQLDELPFAEYDPGILSRLAEPDVGVLQARGCYWGRCTFCDSRALAPDGARYRTRTAACVVDEVAHQIRRHRFRAVALVTDSIPPAFARAFSEEVLKRSLRFRWFSFAMADRAFTPELLRLMKSAGCACLMVGVETMCDRQLTSMNKRARRDDNVRFLEAARSTGIRLKVNIIPDFPGTTHDDAMRSLEDFRALSECTQGSAHISPFYAMRSSEIGRAPGRFGLLPTCHAGEAGAQRDDYRRLTLNQIEVFDPAMTAVERESVFEAYRDFSRQIGERSARAAAARPAADGKYRLDDRTAAWLVRGDTTWVYNALSAERYALAAEWGPILDAVRQLGPFDRDEIVRLARDETQGSDLFTELRRLQLITPVGDVPESPATGPP
jgi:Radical SAM superfamily